eukprot:scaffold447_cov307-Pinguiococcus_pyrenoidosus.AAC.73
MPQRHEGSIILHHSSFHIPALNALAGGGTASSAAWFLGLRSRESVAWEREPTFVSVPAAAKSIRTRKRILGLLRSATASTPCAPLRFS